MSFAYVLNNAIDSVTGRLPFYSHDKTTGDIVKFFSTTSEPDLNRCGWFTVIDDPRPDDTATTTWDASHALVGGIPHRVWTERPKTQAELDGETSAANRATITDAVRAKYTRLRQIRDANKTTFTGLSAAQRDSQLFDAVVDLAEAVVYLGRLQLGDTTDGTN